MVALRAFLADMGYASRVTSTVRSFSQQARLYAAYRAGRTRYPAAPPGSSMHERGLAFDLAADPDALETVGPLAGLWGLRWGGHFTPRDPVHFEALAP